jgi:hypothetical protein
MSIEEINPEVYFQFTGKAFDPASLPRKVDFQAKYQLVRRLTPRDIVVRDRASAVLFTVNISQVGNSAIKLFSALVGIVSAKRLSEPNPFGHYCQYLDSFRDETNIYILYEYKEELHGAHRTGELQGLFEES